MKRNFRIKADRQTDNYKCIFRRKITSPYLNIIFCEQENLAI